MQNGAVLGLSAKLTAGAGVGSPAALRDANRQRVVQVLLRQGARSQAEIARGTGLSRTTVFNIVKELQAARLVTLSEGSSNGRRVLEVAMDRSAGIAVGVDFGHRHLRMVLADLAHAVLAEASHELALGHRADADIALANDTLDTLLAEAGATRADVVGVGLGLPAPIDPETGQVGSSTILPGWVGVPAAEATWQQLGLPVAVDNDANLGALAEMTWGAGRGTEELVYVKASTGVGAGLVLHGRIYRGAAGTAGEIGHMTIDENGAVCRCGSRGCLESYAGANALLALLRPSYGELSLREVITAAQEGDQACRRVIADAGRYIGLAVANVCNLIAPALVVVGGDLAAAGEVLLDPIRSAVDRHVMRPAADSTRIVPAALGERAEVLGAVALVLHESERFTGNQVRPPPGPPGHLKPVRA